MNLLTKEEIKRSNPRIEIEVKTQVDTDRLYGTLDEAIKYLHEIKSEHPTASLEEDWWGYEDMNMVYTYWRAETDEEYEQRIDVLIRKNKVAYEDYVRAQKIESKKAQIDKLQRELSNL